MTPLNVQGGIGVEEPARDLPAPAYGNSGPPDAGKPNMEDEFNEYLNQNESSINSLRNNFGTLWDLEDFLGFDDPNHEELSQPNSNDGEPSTLAYIEGENGSEKRTTMSPLRNVPTETPKRDSRSSKA